MEGNGSSRLGRTSRRYLGGLTATAAVGAVALLALATSAAAGPGINLKGATPLIYYSGNQQGCASSRDVKPMMSMVTGVGHMFLKGSAMTCFPAKGGFLTTSYGDAYAELGAQEVFTAGAAATQFNASFNVTGVELLSAVGKIVHCPYQYYNYTYSVYNGSAYGTEVFSEKYQGCYAEAGMDIFSDSYIQDMTTSTYYYAYGSGTFSEAGQYADNYSYSFNYTNPTFGTNFSYSCSTCWGSLGSAVSTNVNQNVNMSAGVTIAKGDKILMETYIYVDAFTEISHAKAGKALAEFNAASPGHVDLTVFQLS